MAIITQATGHSIAKAAIGADNFADDETYYALVKDTCAAFDSLGINGRLAIEAAYIFSRKVPRDERQDMFQELACAVLDSGTTKPEFAYTITRRDWQNWYAAYMLHSQYHGGYLSQSIVNAEGEETELAELVVGEIEFERKQIDKLDADRLWSQLPPDIQQLVLKRLQGKPLGAPHKRKRGQPKSESTLNGTERQRLNRWVKSEGYKLLIN